MQPGASPNLFLDRAVPAMPVDFAIVMLGTVDTTWGTTPAAYAEQLSILVSSLISVGASHAIVMTPPPWPEFAGGSPSAQTLLLGYREASLALCTEREDTDCIDVFTLLSADYSYFFFASGDLHPNARAHAAIADEIKSTLHAVPEVGSGILLAFGLGTLLAARRAPQLPRVWRRIGF
jgi:hypothetical protein